MFSPAVEQSVDTPNVQARSNNLGAEANLSSFADSSSQKIENNLLSKVNTNSIDLSSLGNTAGTESEVINEIVNHLDKMKLTGAKELNVTVKHNELGKFQINASDVSGAGDSKLNLEILSNSKEVQSFFKANESGLVTLLTDRGFNLSGIKLDPLIMKALLKILNFLVMTKAFPDNNNQEEMGRIKTHREGQSLERISRKMGA